MAVKRDCGYSIGYVYFSAKIEKQMKASIKTRIAYSIGLGNWTISLNDLSLL